ncbi:MAG: DUF378 domain-containing protein [Candidatus Nanoarchaeia archaeon]
MKMNVIDWIAFILVVIGGLNWGLLGLAGIDIVQTIFGNTLASYIVYLIIGLAAIWMIISAIRMGMGMKGKKK